MLIICFSALHSVSFGLITKTKPILASFWELSFYIFRNARFLRSVSMMPPGVLYVDPYFICDRLNSDSRVNNIYTRLVMLHNRWSGKMVLCSLSVGNMLLFVNAGVIMRDDYCRIVEGFDGFADVSVYKGWVDDRARIFRTYIEGEFVWWICCW